MHVIELYDAYEKNALSGYIYLQEHTKEWIFGM